MPLAAAVTEQLYLGDGVSTGPYVLSAEIEVSTDLVVTISGVVTTAYTVSGIGLDAGVSVTFDTAPPNGAEIVLARVAPYDRTRYDYQLGNFKPDTVDADVDRVVMQIQQLATTLLRVPQVARGKTSLNLGLTPEANKLIGWSADALSLVNLTPATITPAALVFSTIGQAIATAANAAAARSAISAVAQTDIDTSMAAQQFRRNWLINGDFRVNQRQASTVACTTAALAWPADMWQCRSSAAPSGTITARALSTGATPGQAARCARLARTVGTYTSDLYLEQVLMDSDDVFALAGKTVTVQAKVRKGAAFSGTSARISLVTTTIAANTWTALAAGTWPSLASTQVVDLPNASLSSTFQTISGQVTVPAGTNGIAVRLEARGFSGAGAANDYLEFTDVQLAEEPFATRYDRRPFAEELARCQRFYEKSWIYSDVSPLGSSFNGAVLYRAESNISTLYSMRSAYKVTKFNNTVPKWYSYDTGAVNQVYNVSSAAGVAVSGTNYNGDSHTGVPVLSAAAVVGNLYAGHWDVDCIV